MDPSQLIQPGHGGLSVSPDDPMHLPYFRRPPEFHGTGKDPLWKIETSMLGPDLVYRPDPADPTHGFIEPRRAMTFDDYQSAIAATCTSWRKVSAVP
jgi:hypothetical protein